MIVVYLNSRGDEVFATHDDYLESEVLKKYPGSMFGAVKVTSSHAVPGDQIPEDIVTIVALDATLAVSSEYQSLI